MIQELKTIDDFTPSPFAVQVIVVIFSVLKDKIFDPPKFSIFQILKILGNSSDLNVQLLNNQ